MLDVYAYKGCDTCRKALKFLRGRGIAFREIAIRETPPPPPALQAMLEAHGGQLRKLFNTSGADYKALGLSAKLPSMPAAEALALLASHGNLVKRPFVIGEGVHLVGFDEVAWTAALSR
jgi:arsenate reductase